MDRDELRPWPAHAHRWQTLRVRAPWALAESRGLGEVVTDVTRAAGIPPCRGCERRAATLNRLVRVPRIHRRHP